MTDRVVDVVVVGGGPSGLVAARELVRGGLDVAVLEARDRVGGRTLSAEVGGVAMDLGGQWVGPTQHRMLALLEELGFETFPTYRRGRAVLDVAGRVSTYRGTIPRLPPLALLQLHLAERRLGRLGRAVDPAAPWTAPDADRLDALTVADWVRRRRLPASARESLAAAVRTVFGAEPHEVSMLYLLRYAEAAGGFLDLVAIDDGAQDRRVTPSMHAVFRRVADDLAGRVHLGAPVSSIEHGDDRVTVASGEHRWSGRRAVLAVPPQFAAEIEITPPWPEPRRRSAGAFRPGATVKVVVAYDRPFWRDRGLSGEVVSTSGPVDVVFDNTVGAVPALVVFVCGDDGRDWHRRPDLERRGSVLDVLVRALGREARHPVEWVEHDWTRDPWARGCPVSNPPPGVLAATRTDAGNPVGALHVAGTEVSDVWPGYLEGALATGMRAARRILAELS